MREYVFLKNRFSENLIFKASQNSHLTNRETRLRNHQEENKELVNANVDEI